MALVSLSIATATEFAAEVETRFVDLTLARPVSRTAVIVRTLIVWCVATSVVLAAMAAGTATGLACCTPALAPRPPAPLIASLVASLAAVMFCWVGVALALASFAKRRATAFGAAGILALGTYLLDYLGRVWETAQFASRFSPFHFFEPMSLVSGEHLKLADVGALTTIGAIGIVTALVRFNARDL